MPSLSQRKSRLQKTNRSRTFDEIRIRRDRLISKRRQSTRKERYELISKDSSNEYQSTIDSNSSRKKVSFKKPFIEVIKIKSYKDNNMLYTYKKVIPINNLNQNVNNNKNKQQKNKIGCSCCIF